MAAVVMDELELRLVARADGRTRENGCAGRPRHCAATLQESLLPPELPTIAGLEIAAAITSRGATRSVATSTTCKSDTEGAAAIVVGDACGKGADGRRRRPGWRAGRCTH